MVYICDCTDLGFPCTWLGTGESSRDVITALMTHLGRAHAIAHSSETLSSYLEDAVRAGEDEEPSVRGLHPALTGAIARIRGRSIARPADQAEGAEQ